MRIILKHVSLYNSQDLTASESKREENSKQAPSKSTVYPITQQRI